MKTLRRFGLFALAISAAIQVRAGISNLILGDNELQTITVTDMTEAGKQVPAPNPQHPLFYAAISGGYHDFGGIIAGEKPVGRAAVNKLMIDVLAKQGYLPAKEGQVPDVIVVWTWGTMNTILNPMGAGSITGSRRYMNEGQLLRFMGGAKLGVFDQVNVAFSEQTLEPGLFFASGDRRKLMDTATDNLYVAVVSAYDTKLDSHGNAVLLWNTRISSPARGFWLPDALPAMVAMAAPFIGHETDRPMWVKATDKFKPEVRLGDLKLVEYLKGTEKTVVDVGPNK